jgi:hypothetical protein
VEGADRKGARCHPTEQLAVVAIAAAAIHQMFISTLHHDKRPRAEQNAAFILRHNCLRVPDRSLDRGQDVCHSS